MAHSENGQFTQGSESNKKVVSACRKVMFHKHRGVDSDSDEDDVSLHLLRDVPRNNDGEMPDVEELTKQRPVNVDYALAHSLFKSSAVSGAWTSLKQKAEERRNSLQMFERKVVPNSKKSLSRKGLAHVINSLVNNLKLSKRYDDKVTLGDMNLTQRQVKLLKMAFASKEQRQEKIETLKTNIAAIDEKVRQIHYQKDRLTFSRNARATSNDRRSLPSMCDMNENFVRFTEQDETMGYFRRWVRVVIIVLRWISVILQISENKRSLDRELKSFTDIANEIERQSCSSRNRSTRGLTFDKTNFVTKKEITLSYDVRRTLTLRSVARTPVMLQQVMHGLQTLESLAEYPLHIQEKLCRVAWYQQIEPKRAILRQGHFAEFFYFILSGQAFVKKMIVNDRTSETEMHTVARLTKGQSFGEVALLYRTTRTATVESATAMELLMVSGEDFIRIFTRTGNPEEEPAYVAFLREIPVFQYWPLSKIKLDPGSCFLHYFKRGSVVTLDSIKSEYIYIIKAGCCEVLQELHGVKPRSSNRLDRIRRLNDTVPALPRANVPVVVSRIDDGSSKTGQKVPVPQTVFNAMNEYYQGIRKSAEEKRLEERRRLEEAISRKEAEERRKAQQSELPDWKNFQKTSRKVSFPDEPKGACEEGGTLLPGINVGSSNHPNKRRGPCRLETLFPEAGKSYMEAPTESALLDMYEPVEDNKKTAYRKIYSLANGSVYVTIELLQSKDVFGLNTLNMNGSPFENVSPVCLVSRGAEIILLSKKMFMKYADDDTRFLVKERVKMYPGESTMQMNLQCEVDWDLYKDTVVNGFLQRRSHAKTLLPTV